jgi:hypothetical protein
MYLGNVRSWGSSVSVVSHYRPDYRATGVRSAVGVRDFSSSGRGVTQTTHHLVPMSMSRSYTLPLVVCMAVAGRLYFLLAYFYVRKFIFACLI